MKRFLIIIFCSLKILILTEKIFDVYEINKVTTFYSYTTSQLLWIILMGMVILMKQVTTTKKIYVVGKNKTITIKFKKN